MKFQYNNLLAPGHTACMGCGELLAVRLTLRATGPNVIVVTATGCIEITTSRFPEVAWAVPWIHSLFENAAAVASGISAGLKMLSRNKEEKVIAMAGDGGTADIGLQALSGMLERGDDVLYMCYDNEAYMNTGIQRSGLTPIFARTTTCPPGAFSWGKEERKKDLPSIVAAHGVPYVATASVGFPFDLERKVKKALTVEGPKYIQVHCTCPLGWQCDQALTIKIAKLAVTTGLFPLFEMEDGKVTRVHPITKKVPVEEYLRPQGRFSHLFKKEGGQEEIRKIQALADENIAKYDMLKAAKSSQS